MKRLNCIATSKRQKCTHYSYELGRCKLGRVKATCPRIKQPLTGTTTTVATSEEVRRFYKCV